MQNMANDKNSQTLFFNILKTGCLKLYPLHGVMKVKHIVQRVKVILLNFTKIKKKLQNFFAILLQNSNKAIYNLPHKIYVYVLCLYHYERPVTLCVSFA